MKKKNKCAKGVIQNVNNGSLKYYPDRFIEFSLNRYLIYGIKYPHLVTLKKKLKRGGLLKLAVF